MEKAATIEDVMAIIDRMSQEIKARSLETDKEIKETWKQIKETGEQIKAMSQETDRQFKARSEETEKQIKARSEEIDRQFKARSEEADRQLKETWKQIKETGKRISELGGRLGEIVEYISSPHLEEKFKAFGIFLDTFIMEHTLEEPGKGIIAEIDIFLSNGDYAVAVEAKVKPNIRDIDEHVERMKKIRGYADRHHDQRKYLGAIAGMVVPDQVKAYAFKQGFPVLVPSGESMELEYPLGFAPKEW
ncbi:MAG: hypothetical protein LBF87_07515 [Treponema sp.]|jgi:membrane-associated HD superfamily phosphohydrolase|nr:hypothetical protein [Treponema sp.]